MSEHTDDATPLELFDEVPRPDASGNDLPRRMGRDARLVARGDLSEDEFYDRYHEQVVERFGIDRRPGGGDG